MPISGALLKSLVAAGKISPAVAAIYAMNLSPEEAQAMYVGPKAKGWKDLPNKFSSLMDKMERAEISDKYARLRPQKEVDFLGPLPGVYRAENVSLQDVISHPDLFRRYPDIAKARGEMFINPSGSSEAVWLGPNDMDRGLQWQVYGRTPQEAQENLLHEIQHAIQEKEGWARGGSQEAMTSELPSIIEQLLKQGGTLPRSRRDAYNRLSGEIEARDTAARMGLTSAQRQASLPYAGQDIPLKDAITKMGVAAPVGAILAEQLAERRKREQQEALQESYSPVDIGMAFATGGTGFLQKILSAISDAGLNYMLGE